MIEAPPIQFRPWVGSHYVEEGLRGLRVLVLGESHYDWDGRATACPDAHELTRFCVEEYLRKRKHQFWTRATRLLSSDGEPNAELWLHLAYYNFVQTLLTKNKRPTKEMWRASHAAFEATLAIVRPHCVLVLGKTLWISMPSGMSSPALSVEGHDRPTRRYSVTRSESALSTFVPHPRSRGFKIAQWRPVAQALLAESSGGIRPT